MKSVKILDCTLRDGGYINNWSFGYDNIKKIISGINQANVEIIECGFLKNVENENINSTVYNDFDLDNKYGKDLFLKNKRYVLMMLAESYDITKLKDNNKSVINTIRLSFHKRDLKKAISMAKVIIDKGYDLFMQPTATMRYSDDELIELINVCNNEIKPVSLAIVDTFGEMLAKDIKHLTLLFDKYLDKNIILSFHAHNNLQNAFNNSTCFLESISSNREVVIDASIYGMGRGAGNLCEELLIDYLNKVYKKDYNLEPILDVSDNVISKFRNIKYWGYSLEYYLSAINRCHPNYCDFFSNKKTLTTKDLQNLLSNIASDKRIDFDKEYAEDIYRSYNEKVIDDYNNYKRLEKIINGKEIIIIGPGKSIIDNHKELEKYIRNKSKYFSIFLNSETDLEVDAVFFSNRKRFNETILKKDKIYIYSSNIKSKSSKDMVFDYQKNLASEYEIMDNSLLLILNIIKKIYSDNIYLAGIDGFDIDSDNNFYDEKLLYTIDRNTINNLNDSMKKYLNLYSKELKIKFITRSKYEK